MLWLNRILKLKKYDFYLAGAMCIIALVLFLIIQFSSSNGNMLLVYRDNILVDEYNLEQDGIYTVCDADHIFMTFEIKNKSVNVKDAECKDKLCVRQKSISASSELICCLPNKIILEIAKSDDDKDIGEYDAITK